MPHNTCNHNILFMLLYSNIQLRTREGYIATFSLGLNNKARGSQINEVPFFMVSCNYNSPLT